MSNDAELIESTIQTIAHLTHSSNTLQDKLRADAASGECSKSTNLTLIAAANAIDQLMEARSQLIEDLKLSGDTGISMMMKRGVKGLCEDKLALTRQVAELERQLAESQKNAERYLFVRNETSNLDFGLINNGWILEGSKADEIIDAAMKVKP